MLSKVKITTFNLILFLFVFAIPFKGVPANSAKWVLVLIFFICFICIVFKQAVFLTRKELNYFFVLATPIFLGMFLASFKLIFSGTNDFDLLYTYYINFLESLVGAILILAISRVFGFGIKTVLKSIITILLMQSSIILISLFLEPVREFFFVINKFEPSLRSLFFRYSGFRGLGFSGQVTYDLSVLLSLSLLFTIIYLELKNTSISLIEKIFIFSLPILAVFITGRTGLLVFFVLIFYSLYLGLVGGKSKVIFKMVFFSFVFSLLVIFLINNLELLSGQALAIAKYVLEIFINLSSSGSASSDSTDVLLRMLGINISLDTLAFGDGYWLTPDGGGRYYRDVDSGYLRHILFYGLPFTIVIFSIFIASFFLSLQDIKMKSKRVYLLLLGMVFYFLVVEIKGDFIFGSAMNMKLLWLSTLLMVESKAEDFKRVVL